MTLFELFYDLTGGAPAAGLILAAILVISIIGLSVSPALIARALLRPYEIARGRHYFTLISSGFVHAGYAHLLFNAMTLWSFGFALERRIGSVRFLLLYVLGLIVSDLGTVYKQRNNPDYASLGASGAILAVLFAAIIYFPTQSIYVMFIPVAIPAWMFALGYLAYSLYASRYVRDHINHDAHLGGAVAGVAFVLLTDADAVRQALVLVL